VDFNSDARIKSATCELILKIFLADSAFESFVFNLHMQCVHFPPYKMAIFFSKTALKILTFNLLLDLSVHRTSNYLTFTTNYFIAVNLQLVRWIFSRYSVCSKPQKIGTSSLQKLFSELERFRDSPGLTEQFLNKLNLLEGLPNRIKGQNNSGSALCKHEQRSLPPRSGPDQQAVPCAGMIQINQLQIDKSIDQSINRQSRSINQSGDRSINQSNRGNGL
jgi:hypothetical protein